MSIDLMKKATIVCEAAASQRLIRTLHGLGAVEVRNALEYHPEAEGVFEQPAAATEDCDVHLQKINLALGLLDHYLPIKKTFVQGLAVVPLVVEPQELNDAIHRFEAEPVFRLSGDLDETHRRIEHTAGDIRSRLAELRPFESIPFNLSDLRRPQRTRLIFGMIAEKGLAQLREDPEAADKLTCEPIIPGPLNRKGHADGAPLEMPSGTGKRGKGRNEPVRIVVACLTEDEPEARTILGRIGFQDTPLPDLPGKVRDHIRELEGDLDELECERAILKEKVTALALHRRTLTILRAFWENRRQLALAKSQSLQGRWTSVICGYVRVTDLPRVEEILLRDFPTAALTLDDPQPGEDTPVSLTLSKAVRPLQMLVNLFGLPKYETFDPTPFMVVNFYLFFGICFSDVAYGLMLIIASAYLLRRTRPYEGLQNFGKLLLIGGFSTIVFGALMGSFFGDLYTAKYMGEGNPILAGMSKVQLIDPLEKPIVVLLIALLLGMLNQFYGIALKMYSSIKQGNRMEAVYDGLCWLVTLPGVVIMISKMFAPVPDALFTAGLVLFVAGATGLVLFQGRESKTLVGRFGTGIVSLYGIVGTYGITAFIGDTMSYCRLLALGLTTSIVALSFNMMAGLLKDIPVVGLFLFIVALVVGHVFNFTISLLGAFVHSMRLIFVEFFGRFYDGGAKRFAPLGFDSPKAILKR